MINTYIPDIIQRKVLTIKELNKIPGLFPQNQFLVSKIADENLRQAESIQECRIAADKYPILANQAEQKAEAIALKLNTVNALSEFVSIFPRAKNQNSIEKKIVALKLIEYQNAYKNAERQNTSLAFTSYIKKYDGVAPKELVESARLFEYRLSYKECSSSQQFATFISKYRDYDPEKLVQFAKVGQYKISYQECTTSNDFNAFIEKYQNFDPEDLLVTAKQRAYELMYKECQTSYDYGRFIEKYKTNDPNNFIPSAQEQQSYLREQERLEQLAEQKRREERRKLEEELRNTKWVYEVQKVEEWSFERNTIKSSCEKDIKYKGYIIFRKQNRDGSQSLESESVQYEVTNFSKITSFLSSFCSEEYSVQIFTPNRRNVDLIFGRMERYSEKFPLNESLARWESWEVKSLPQNYWQSLNTPAEILPLLIQCYIREILQKPKD